MPPSSVSIDCLTTMSPSLFTGCAVIIALIVFLSVEAVESYKVIWMVPTFMCTRYGINFTADLDKYGFTKNSLDYLHGEEINLLYSPGMFPALLNMTNDSSSIDDLVPRNGGIPQKGDLSLHLEALKTQIEKYLPNVENKGLVVIDFEEWIPLYGLSNGSTGAYQITSRTCVMKDHPEFKTDTAKIETMAKEAFENASKSFLSETLDFGSKLRPKAKWGYYSYPLCFKAASSTLCSPDTVAFNDNMQWLYNKSSALFPSIDINSKMSESDKTAVIEFQIKEALRVSKRSNRNLPVYAFIYYKYSDDNNFITQGDLEKLTNICKTNGAEGVVFWGPKSDFQTQQQCDTFNQYFNNVLGPNVRKSVT